MIYDSNHTTEDIILEELIDKKLSIKNLQQIFVLKYRRNITLRALYKVVDKHIKNGVLLKVGKEVLLDQEWLDKVKRNLLQREPELKLGVGESAFYIFSSINEVDAYWKTATKLLQPIDSSYPLFIYNPHDFWIYMKEREESEDGYYKGFKKRKEYCFFIIGGETAVDNQFKKKYQNEYFQIHLENIPKIRRTDHITILSDYVITVRISELISDEIDYLFNKEKDLEENIYTTLLKAQKIKLKIENNPKKAKMLRKKFSKNFYIPKKLQSNYKLF